MHDPTPSVWRALRDADASAAAELTLDRGQVRELLELGPFAVEVDPDYDARAGFDEQFLGRPVPLPELGGELRADAAPMTAGARAGDVVIPYHHFSLVMSASRRLARYTAVNIDGRRRIEIERGGDRWLLDPRLPAGAQIGNELYLDNQLDRGHLVRRRDAGWGDTLAESRAANDDTFHYTNAAPQHAIFNQSPQLWHGLEDYILGRVAERSLRANVTTGPILAADDPEYRDVLIPRAFWKVVATVTEAGELFSAAYLLSQDAFVGTPAAAAEPPFGPYRTFQVTVARIEELTGLRMPAQAAADRAAAGAVAPGPREIRELPDLRL
jgi:endonuclease G